jgi:FdhE protein
MNELLSKEIIMIEKGFDSIERERPYLKPIVTSFKEIMISRAILKSRIADRTDLHIQAPVPSYLAQGRPWLTDTNIVSFMEPWGELVESILSPLASAFPSISTHVLKLKEAFNTGKIDLKQCIGSLVECDEEAIINTGNKLDTKPDILKFILFMMLKPFVEKRVESVRSLVENIPWLQGYCPICGALPEASLIRGETEDRLLKCSLCGHEWRFDKMACPYCGERKGSIESIRIIGNDQEWVNLCHDCHKYIVGMDLRKQAGLIVDVAIIGMVHLDTVAQSKGYLPVAECAWNMVLPDN